MNKTKSMFKLAFLISVFVLLPACITRNIPISTAEETQITVEAETSVHIPPYSSAMITMGDGGLLSEQSCKPPCLWGMTPGITHEAELWEILKSKESANGCEVWDFSSDGGERLIICRWNNGAWVTIGLDAQQDVIQSITFPLSTTTRIDDIVKKYGTPTWVSIEVMDKPEHTFTAVDLTVFYDEITTRLHFLRQGEKTAYNLLPEAEIIMVSYMNPKEYTEFLGRQETLVPWNGYGEYGKK